MTDAPSTYAVGVPFEKGECYTFEDGSAWVFCGAYWIKVGQIDLTD